MTRAVFSLCIFAGSFLLFLIQPMVGKILLPCLGGVPAVWTACMLFFQTALLAGYVYAEKSIKWLGCDRQSVLHLMLMVFGYLLLPVNVNVAGVETAFSQPTTWLLTRLTASIGFLFFIMAANAPLIQRYYSRTGQSDSADPYFLYSASNAGSLLALLAYPFALEPILKVSQQRYLWSGLYILQTLLVFACCLQLWRAKKADGRVDQNSEKVALSPTWRDAVRWSFYGFLPCSAMLGVTTHIATDIASGPMLWIFPLSLYLISFILVFARNELWRSIKWERLLFPVTLLIIATYHLKISEPSWLTIPLHLLGMFLICMCFHSRLANNRPPAALLNSFYVWMSVGGIAGGIFNGIIAPISFTTQAEYILTLLLAALTVSAFSRINSDKDVSNNREILVLTGYIACVAVLAWLTPANKSRLLDTSGLYLGFVSLILIHLFYRFRKMSGIMLMLIAIMGAHSSSVDSRTIFIDRSFFGILRISRLATDGIVCDADLKIPDVQDIFYCLHHGTTLHGVERKVDVRPVFPLSYYSRESPIGLIFRAGLTNRSFKNIGVVGLGCGTLAWYGRSWQHFDFFEIDPKVVEIAENPKYFTYLSKSKASWKNIVGDARINLQLVPDHTYDLLVIDAYSSDSVPVHLMTLEAFKLYQAKIKKDGVLVLHISNRYFKLSPVIKLICDQIGMSAVRAFDEPKRYSIRYDWYDMDQVTRSDWVAATSDPEKMRLLRTYGDWKELPEYERYALWTDDYANMLQVYNWR